ncbi:MAG: IS4 family transposase [Paracoccaceae bacterium]|nr:IS4 family transposase [Paracoccaceae bacterium]
MPNRKPPSAASLLRPEVLCSIARSSGLIARHSHKFDASSFVLSLLGAVSRGASSLNHIAVGLASFAPRAMSRQAMAGRFSEKSSAFLGGVISSVVAARGGKVFASLSGMPFTRILVEDSTVVSMFRGNAAAFPNNGNGKVDTAGCKLDLITDLLSGEAVAARFCAAREPDQKLASEIFLHCREGDLVLRDMGYFCAHVLDDMDTRGVYWMSRLPAGVSLRDRRGRPLLEMLKAARRNRVDVWVEVGSRTPLHCRLVATRLSEEQAAANRRERKRSSHKRGATTKREALVRDGWSLVVTSVPKEMLPARSVWDVYAQRWSIEIGFRAIKQSSNTAKALGHKSSEHHIKALVLATALLMVLGMKVHARLRAAPEAGGAASLEKICDAFADYLLRRNRHTLDEPFDPDPRHIAHDKRSRLTLRQSITLSLG